MSEYWKSVPRKFCDFCKCWITDNKPSVDFHERGKRHKEAVEQRLKEVRKKSYADSIEQSKIDKQMEKMEKAALAAFKKDLAANPELAKQYGVSLEPKPKPKTDSTDSQKDDDDKKEEKEKEWHEAKSPEGYSYYWNTVTGESRWEAPEEYLSIEEKEAKEKAEKEAKEKAKKEAKEKAEKEVAAGFEAGDNTEDTPIHEEKQIQDPSFSRSAFGAWSVVREESQPVIYDNSSQAPAPEDIPLPDIALPKPKSDGPKFKEKTVKSLAPSSSSDSGMPTFKKRKLASGARNVRQRGNDD